MRKRYDIQEILANPAKRRDLMVKTIMALQRREGKKITRRQAEVAYDRVQKRLSFSNLLVRWERGMIRLAGDAGIMGSESHQELEL